MSTQKPTEVVLSVRQKADKRYHRPSSSSKQCPNAPEEANEREINRAKIEGHYEPCSMCFEGIEPMDTSGHNQFECAECGEQRKVASAGVRTLQPCPDCGGVTRHERVNQ